MHTPQDLGCSEEGVVYHAGGGGQVSIRHSGPQEHLLQQAASSVEVGGHAAARCMQQGLQKLKGSCVQAWKSQAQLPEESHGRGDFACGENYFGLSICCSHQPSGKLHQAAGTVNQLLKR